MIDIDWPEREIDMALIRQVNGLMLAATSCESIEDASQALADAKVLLPAYAEATRRFNAAMRAFLAGRTAHGSHATH